MCSHTVASEGAISIREMGLPASETLVQTRFKTGVWVDVVGYGLSTVLEYFEGTLNAAHTNLLTARTVPILAPVSPVVLVNVGKRYLAVLQISTKEFPQQAEFDASFGALLATAKNAEELVREGGCRRATCLTSSRRGAPPLRCTTRRTRRSSRARFGWR